MPFLLTTMLVILVVCGVVALYVTFPHRGEQVPGAPWLGDAMARAADAITVLDETDGDPAGDGTGTADPTGEDRRVGFPL